MQVLILLIASSLVGAHEERTLTNVGIPFLGQNLFPSFFGGGNSSNSNKPSSLLPQPFLQPQSQINDLLSLFQNISQLFAQFQGQNGTEGKQKISLGPISQNPIFTTLPFNNLSSEEISWFWEGAPQQDNHSNDMLREKQNEFFGNGGNTTFGDLNFLTIPQLLGAIGRR